MLKLSPWSRCQDWYQMPLMWCQGFGMGLWLRWSEWGSDLRGVWMMVWDVRFERCLDEGLKGVRIWEVLGWGCGRRGRQAECIGGGRRRSREVRGLSSGGWLRAFKEEIAEKDERVWLPNLLPTYQWRNIPPCTSRPGAAENSMEHRYEQSNYWKPIKIQKTQKGL